MKLLLAVFVLLSAVFRGSAVLDRRTLTSQQSQMKHERHFIQDEEFLANAGQVFGTCYEMKLSRHKIDVSCTFIMETSEDIDYTDHLRVCNFTLSSATHYYKKNFYIPLKITAIDENTAFLAMAYREQKAFYLLHFANCNTGELEIKLENPRVAAPEEDVFDIVVKKDERGLCKSKYYRLVLDTDGNIITSMYDWLHEDNEIIAIAPATLKGRVVIDKLQKHWKNRNDGLIRIYSVERDGIINISKQYQAQVGHYGATTASTTYQLLTVCTTNIKSLTYAQFNWNGNLKFDGVWKDERIDLIYTLKVHNLPDGGFLLVMTLCYKENNVKKCGKNSGNIFLKKFDNVGRTIGSLDITNWEHVNVKQLHFHVNNNKKMCLSNANGHDAEYNGNIYVDIICFTDADFTTVFL